MAAACRRDSAAKADAPGVRGIYLGPGASRAEGSSGSLSSADLGPSGVTRAVPLGGKSDGRGQPGSRCAAGSGGGGGG
jgi:hypothetical protein